MIYVDIHVTSLLSANAVPAGRSWTGTAHWNSCVNRHYNQMSLLITGNRRMNHFPSRMWVDAVIVDTWTEAHEQVRHQSGTMRHRRSLLQQCSA